VAGGKGALGALVGVVVVALFFTASLVVVGWVSRVKPAAMMPTALGTFIAKILLLLLLVAAFRGTTVLNTKVFGFTAIACVLVWSAGQVATLARRMPYVEPVKSDAMSDPAPEEPAVNTGGDR
jgi:ATP synthase protein I